MPLTTTEPRERLKSAPSSGGPGFGDGGKGGDDGDRGGPDGDAERRVPRRAYYTGILVALAPVLMLFAALASSYIVRKGLSGDWETLEIPGLLWVNSALLLFSSAALELARRNLKQGRQRAFEKCWTIGTALGLAFMVGQAVVWYQLRAQGVYFSTNPSHSFFYLLTVAHAVHVLGGVAALGWVLGSARNLPVHAGHSLRVDLSAIYWHFMDGIWIFLIALFLLGR